MASVRAPDVVLVGDLVQPKDAIYTGTPILAVEVRGTQSKRNLEEKVKLYLEHDWPCTWIVHVGRKQQVEVLRPGLCARGLPALPPRSRSRPSSTSTGSRRSQWRRSSTRPRGSGSTTAGSTDGNERGAGGAHGARDMRAGRAGRRPGPGAGVTRPGGARAGWRSPRSRPPSAGGLRGQGWGDPRPTARPCSSRSGRGSTSLYGDFAERHRATLGFPGLRAPEPERLLGFLYQARRTWYFAWTGLDGRTLSRHLDLPRETGGGLRLAWEGRSDLWKRRVAPPSVRGTL